MHKISKYWANIRWTTLIFITLATHPLFAQLNESDTVNFKANLSLTGAWQEGNAEVLIFRGKAEATVKPINALVFKTQNSYLYQEFFKRRADEDIYSRNILYLKPERKFYPFLLGFISTNFRRKIDLRYFVGGGATWQIVHNQNHWVKLAISGEYEETDFARDDFNEDNYDGNSFIRTWRATAWVFGKHHLFDKKMIFHYESYIQPSVEESNNFRWQADVGLELPIWKFLNFKVNYLYTYENVVVENQRQVDRLLTFGIKVSL